MHRRHVRQLQVHELTMRNRTLNLFAAAIVAAGMGWLALPSQASALATQRCTERIVQPDGTIVTITVEGDRCVFNTSTWTCTCT